MIRKILTIACLLCSMIASAQSVNLKDMKRSERNKYLRQIAKEAVLNFGPNYYREYKEFEIPKTVYTFTTEDEREEITKHIGRKYYAVFIRYDKTKEKMSADFAARVYVWEDTGEPFRIMFGCNWGRNFFFEPYFEMVKNGIKEEDQIK